MFNKPVIRSCFGGGYIRGGRLTSHNHGAAFIVNMAIFGWKLQHGHPIRVLIILGKTCQISPKITGTLKCR